MVVQDTRSWMKNNLLVKELGIPHPPRNLSPNLGERGVGSNELLASHLIYCLLYKAFPDPWGLGGGCGGRGSRP
jgi:hypothetical protein